MALEVRNTKNELLIHIPKFDIWGALLLRISQARGEYDQRVRNDRVRAILKETNKVRPLLSESETRKVSE